MSEESVETSPPPPRRLLRRIAWFGLLAIIWIVAIGFSLWAILAVYFANLTGAPPRTWRALLFAAMLVASGIFIKPRKYGRAGFVVLILCVLAWYFSIRPLNNRDWLPDVARTPTFDIAGDVVTIHNVRDFDWRSETDYTPNWSDRTYRLSDLKTVDIILCRWGSKAIAHGMVSFGFGNGQYLCASIETRKERTESYSAIQGFFRQYELIYVFADERDIIRIRTDFRKEDVYLFRTNVKPDKARELLLGYASRANDLAATPQFYNALTSNCVTNIVHIAKVVNPSARINWEILLSGYAARRAYENGRLDKSMPYDELEAKSQISPVAIRIGNDPNFSRLIRAELPMPKP